MTRPFWLGEDQRGFDHIRIHLSVIEDERLTIHDLAVYTALVRFAETTNGQAKPSQKQVAAKARCGIRQVRTSIRHLEELLYIETHERPGKVQWYRVLKPPLLTPAPHAGVPDPQPQPRHRVPDTPAPHAGPTPSPHSSEPEPINQSLTPAPYAGVTKALTADIWESYRAAYQKRYGVDPVRNPKVNGQLAAVVKRLGVEEAPHVAAFYISHNDAWYVRIGHSTDALMKDAEKLRTEWATGKRINARVARDQERFEGSGAVQLLREVKDENARRNTRRDS